MYCFVGSRGCKFQKWLKICFHVFNVLLCRARNGNSKMIQEATLIHTLNIAFRRNKPGKFKTNKPTCQLNPSVECIVEYGGYSGRKFRTWLGVPILFTCSTYCCRGRGGISNMTQDVELVHMLNQVSCKTCGSEDTRGDKLAKWHHVGTFRT